MKYLLNILINRPRIVHLLLIFIFLVGITNLLTIKRVGYPNVDFGMIAISTVYPGASAEDVKLEVTQKIEEELKSLDNIKRMLSSSAENLSQITIYLEDDVNFNQIENDIQKCINRVPDLPSNLPNPPKILKVDNDRIPVMDIAIVANDNSYNKMYVASNEIESKLMQLPNISTIKKSGYQQKEIRISIDTKKMIKHELVFNDIIYAIKEQNNRIPGGDLKSKNEKKIIIRSDFISLEDIKNTIIRSDFSGNKIQINDIASVNFEYKTPEKYISYNGVPCILLSIQKKSSADILETVSQVNSSLANLKQYYKDITIKTAADYSVEVNSLLDLVKSNALYGFLLVLFLLILLLDLQVAFWTAIGIPTAIFMAFMVLPALGVTINFISLLGIILVLGMVVDDAIVVSENIYKYKEAGLSGKESAIKGTLEVLAPLLATILTTIIAFAPLAFMSGILGKFMVEMPIVVNLVLISSLIECLLMLPVHIAYTKLPKKKHLSKRFFDFLQSKYQVFINYSLNHKSKIIFLFVAILGISIWILTNKMQFILFHNNDGLYGAIEFKTPKGSSLQTTTNMAKKIETILLTFPKSEIEGFTTTIGDQIPEIMTYGTNESHSAVGNILIYLSPYKKRNRNATEIMNDVKQKIGHLNEFNRLEAYSIKDGPPIGKAVTITVVSDNPIERKSIQKEIVGLLKSLNGVQNITTSQGKGKDRFECLINHDQAARLGVSITTIMSTIQTYFKGNSSSSVNWDNDILDIIVTVPEEKKESVKGLKELFVRNKFNKLIQLDKLITFETQPDVLNISHYDAITSVTIYADVNTDIITSKQVNNKIKQELPTFNDKYPLSSIVFGGEERDTNEAMQSLGIALIIALVGIYSVLVILFNSFSQPFVAMCAIPFTLPGIIFAFYTHNIVFGFTAIIGLIGLMGVVVNNSLIMISFINKNIKQDSFSYLAVAKGAAKRFRPIIITTLTTSIGLIPSAYGLGGENSFLVPMVMAIVWGLLFSCLVTLILTPTIYTIHYKFFKH